MGSRNADPFSALIASLKRHGVDNDVIDEALREVAQKYDEHSSSH
ncbi:hypothetical protein [Anabaena sp. UHCC 0399]|nr:hypothetical protein [Anabaena sp. UHCC 0399]MEA5566222.1 hypothetical protein [Anabaena sp. UHCC 0399]